LIVVEEGLSAYVFCDADAVGKGFLPCFETSESKKVLKDEQAADSSLAPNTNSHHSGHACLQAGTLQLMST
jgi:hypothetical protein